MPWLGAVAGPGAPVTFDGAPARLKSGDLMLIPLTLPRTRKVAGNFKLKEYFGTEPFTWAAASYCHLPLPPSHHKAPRRG